MTDEEHDELKKLVISALNRAGCDNPHWEMPALADAAIAAYRKADYLRWTPIAPGTWPAEAVVECAKMLCFAEFASPPPGMTPDDYWKGVIPRKQNWYINMARQTIAVLARKG